MNQAHDALTPGSSAPPVEIAPPPESVPDTVSAVVEIPVPELAPEIQAVEQDAQQAVEIAGAALMGAIENEQQIDEVKEWQLKTTQTLETQQAALSTLTETVSQMGLTLLEVLSAMTENAEPPAPEPLATQTPQPTPSQQSESVGAGDPEKTPEKEMPPDQPARQAAAKTEAKQKRSWI